VFRLARPLGVGRLLAYSPSAVHALAAELAVEMVGLEAVLEQSDFLCVN
jgi:phosphoglycerate dehydrogenase-like enzyme